jgi:hypothetical protein
VNLKVCVLTRDVLHSMQFSGYWQYVAQGLSQSQTHQAALSPQQPSYRASKQSCSNAGEQASSNACEQQRERPTKQIWQMLWKLTCVYAVADLFMTHCWQGSRSGQYRLCKDLPAQPTHQCHQPPPQPQPHPPSPPPSHPPKPTVKPSNQPTDRQTNKQADQPSNHRSHL